MLAFKNFSEKVMKIVGATFKKVIFLFFYGIFSPSGILLLRYPWDFQENKKTKVMIKKPI